MLSFLFSPRGRFRRRDYWLGTFIVMLVLATGLAADIVFRGVVFVPVGASGAFTMRPEPIFFGLAGLLILWPAIAMGIKRWHDRDKSGWLVVLGFIPVVNLYALVSLLFLRGTPDLNRFGPDPRRDDALIYAGRDDAHPTA